jgi:hypothetical protein
MSRMPLIRRDKRDPSAPTRAVNPDDVRKLVNALSERNLDLMFGDVGAFWWAAPKADVAAGGWTSTRFNFQCS